APGAGRPCVDARHPARRAPRRHRRGPGHRHPWRRGDVPPVAGPCAAHRALHPGPGEGGPVGLPDRASPVWGAAQEGAVMIRACRDSDVAAIEEIVNEAARAYRGVIPDDCWHEPYMTRSALLAELAAGVA